MNEKDNNQEQLIDASRKSAIKLNPAYIPPTLHSLISYAEKWGISDKNLQLKMLHEASLEEIEKLCVVIYPLWDEIFNFATSHPSPETIGSYEVETFNIFRLIFSDIFGILGDKKPQKLLEIIGWPEAWPSFKPDPTKLPPELHPLIPFIEKWVIRDEGVRWTAIEVATNAEIKDLLSVVDQIGRAQIEDLIYPMIENELLLEQGASVVLLMELVDHIRRKQHD